MSGHEWAISRVARWMPYKALATSQMTRHTESSTSFPMSFTKSPVAYAPTTHSQIIDFYTGLNKSATAKTPSDSTPWPTGFCERLAARKVHTLKPRQQTPVRFHEIHILWIEIKHRIDFSQKKLVLTMLQQQQPEKRYMYMPKNIQAVSVNAGQSFPVKTMNRTKKKIVLVLLCAMGPT